MINDGDMKELATSMNVFFQQVTAYLLESFDESWILERITSKLDVHQYGALKRRSTTHALIDMTHDWLNAVDKGQSVHTVFIDFTKAFDRVDHNILVAKMRALDLPDVITCWMCSFLRHRRQQVVIGDVMSDWVQMVAGMPQGSYLGPLTFVIPIDALHPICMTRKFIDDTTMTKITNRSDISCMQSSIDELVHRTSEIGMQVNIKKTKEMFISSTLKDPPPSVTLSGETVETVAIFNSLGVHVSNNLKWAQHIQAISAKGASRLYFLK